MTDAAIIFLISKDWRIRDNLTIAINSFNKYHIVNDYIDGNIKTYDLFTVECLFRSVLKYAKKHNLDLVTAGINIKEFVKKNKNMTKNSLQKAISLL